MKHQQNFFLNFQNDPLKDMAIDEFLNTPIDSRSSSVDADFSKPLHISSYEYQKQAKRKPKSDKELMHQWDKKIDRLSRNVANHYKPKPRNIVPDHPSLAERALIKKSDMAMRARTALERDRDFRYPEENREGPTSSRSAFMPLRKNEIPVGRYMPDALLLKKTKIPFE